MNDIHKSGVRLPLGRDICVKNGTLFTTSYVGDDENGSFGRRGFLGNFEASLKNVADPLFFVGVRLISLNLSSAICSYC
jgi:hypothetical protein